MPKKLLILLVVKCLALTLSVDAYAGCGAKVASLVRILTGRALFSDHRPSYYANLVPTPVAQAKEFSFNEEKFNTVVERLTPQGIDEILAFLKNPEIHPYLSEEKERSLFHLKSPNEAHAFAFDFRENHLVALEILTSYDFKHGTSFASLALFELLPIATWESNLSSRFVPGIEPIVASSLQEGIHQFMTAMLEAPSFEMFAMKPEDSAFMHVTFEHPYEELLKTIDETKNADFDLIHEFLAKVLIVRVRNAHRFYRSAGNSFVYNFEQTLKIVDSAKRFFERNDKQNIAKRYQNVLNYIQEWRREGNETFYREHEHQVEIMHKELENHKEALEELLLY